MSSFPAEFPRRLGLSDASETLYDWLKPLFKEDEKYGQPGLKLCVGFGKMLDPAWEIVNPLGYGYRPPFTLLFDPTNAKLPWLEWMAQFVGTDLTRAPTEQIKREWVAGAKNWLRGLPPSIKQAIEATLTGKKTIYFYTRYNNEAYRLKVAVNSGECPSEKETRIAVEEAIPAWIALEFVVITGGTYETLEAVHAKVSEMEAAHVKYEDIETEPAK